jgi:hypothetical protein
LNLNENLKKEKRDQNYLCMMMMIEMMIINNDDRNAIKNSMMAITIETLAMAMQ